MARTPEGAQLTEAHRQLQGRISAATLADLLSLWGVVDPADLRGTIDPFMRAALAVVKNGRRTSSTASQRYYMAFRQVEGVQGAAFITMAPQPPDVVTTAALRGGALAGILNAKRRGLSNDAAHANGFVKMSGSAAQIVAGGGRATLLGAIRADPEAHGYQRVTDGAPCAFCAMVASRGIVAYSEDSAGFEAHNHCGCTAEPAFEGSKVRPDNARLRQAWDEATSGLGGTDALNAFRRSMSPSSTT